VRFAWTDGLLRRNNSLCPQFALFSEQSVERHVGASVSPHVWIAGRDHKLLEQLRTISVSGKIDSSSDPKLFGPKQHSRLWRWNECAGLVVRARSRRSIVASAHARSGSPNLQHRRP